MTTRHVFANRTFAHLASAIVPGSTSITLIPGDINYILPAFSSGTWLFLVLCDYLNHSEIVKVTAIQGDSLTVERAQGGTSARTWYAGTMIMSRPVAAIFDQILQQGIFRSGAYNPNGVIAGLYIGEKFYQTGPAAAQRRWWKYTNDSGGIGTGDRWRLLAGSPYGAESEDDDGFYYYIPYWVNYSDPSYWDIMSDLATWDPVNLWWDTGINSVGDMIPTGTWHVGKRWPDMYIMVLTGFFSLSWEIDDADDAQIDVSNWGYPSEISEEVRSLTWGSYDFANIYSDNRASEATFRIYANEGAPYDPDWVTLDVTTNSFWTATVGSWNGTSWDMVWNGSNYEVDLTAIGGWMTGEIFNRFKVTGNLPPTKYFAEVRFKDGTATTIGKEGADANPCLGTFYKSGDIASVRILGNYHGVDPGGTWQVTKIELFTESIYT